ncbi:MAG: putative DNA binding domain-containing protein [Chloroflexi bacterium]|nr:putative DNA binding domain-containing protein [Chloroflexota bacterium]
MRWYRVDLHLHTAASREYEEPDVTYLQMLEVAEEQELDIIAFTDHNSVAGYASMQRQIEALELLERLGRLNPSEKEMLEEYRRLLRKILVLPGFEFTATLGFHILGIFSEKTPVRLLEHLLLELRVPPDKLDEGSTEVGATTDVLTAYRVVDAAGGLVIAAHVNSAHGVAMRGFGYGGQTKIAYTQDPHLHALETTDLETKGRRTIAAFYNGSKPEYPRRMHCIQGSDAHRLRADPLDRNKLGIGDRATEILLPEPTFEAIKAVFLGDDFTRTRPYRRAQAPFDYVEAARAQGPNIVQSFHDSMERKGGHLRAILCDVVAFANTKGGTIFVGVGPNLKTPPKGVDAPEQAIATLLTEIKRAITPPLEVDADVLKSRGRNIIRLNVPEGDDPPYALEGTRIYIRQESETSEAVRDEIVQLVKEALGPQIAPPEAVEAHEVAHRIEPPKTGVEIIETVEREGTLYHTMKDLRNGNVVRDVTRTSARKLWQYAIVEKETNPVTEDKVTWRGDIGLWKSYRRAGRTRYDFVQRGANGTLHVYYGVTEEGVHGEWREFMKGE